MKEWNNRKLIERNDWTDSFDRIAKAGDLVEEEIVDQFINCVPPACMRSDCMQCGEPYSHEKDRNGKYRATYTTFKKVVNGIYEFCGYCFAGENTAYDAVTTL